MKDDERSGARVYLAILFLFAGVAVALGSDGLVAAAFDGSPSSIGWTSLVQSLSALLMISVSLTATVNGCRAWMWKFSTSDVLFGVVKGLSLALLAAISHPDRMSLEWPLIATIYATVVGVHLGHVRRVASGASPSYRKHLRDAQRGTIFLAFAMSICFVIGCFASPTLGARMAPAVAAVLGILALRAESVVARAASG